MTRFLAVCRHLMLIPVIGCVLLTAGVVIMGMGRIVTAGVALARGGDFSAKTAKIMSLTIIEIIDLFLIGTVAYIAAVGLFKLFIIDREVDLPMARQIKNLANLENKIIGVIVAALAVAFLGHATGPDEPAALLRYGGGVAVVIVALAYFMRQGGKDRGPDSDK